MFQAIRRWREQRVLRSSAIPEPLWREALEALPFTAIYTDEELARLREKVVLFLNGKNIVGAREFEVTPFMRTVIALQACALVLNLDLRFYEGFTNVVVYPGEFIPDSEWEDEFGVVHRYEDPLAGEAMHGGPVVLSWPDVAASADWESAGMNLVIHEFAHKIDMCTGDANGCPPLPANVPRTAWIKTLRQAYEHFGARVQRGEDTAIDPYAAESPGEFFAVLSEIFFADPTMLREEYPALYLQFTKLYRQDPAARAELLRED